VSQFEDQTELYQMTSEAKG